MKAFYFPHDDNAAGDERVLKLRAKFGNTEGYAMWFMLLEFLSRNDGYMDGTSMAELSICYSIPAEKWRPFVDMCTDLRLLHSSKNGLFSPRMADALKLRRERSESGKKGAASKWGSQRNGDGRANGKPMAQPMPGEERIEEERIELKKPKKIELTDDEAVARFSEIVERERWSDGDKWNVITSQIRTMPKKRRDECYRKMRVAINGAAHPRTLGMARNIFNEIAGYANDFGPMAGKEPPNRDANDDSDNSDEPF